MGALQLSNRYMDILQLWRSSSKSQQTERYPIWRITICGYLYGCITTLAVVLQITANTERYPIQTSGVILRVTVNGAIALKRYEQIRIEHHPFDGPIPLQVLNGHSGESERQVHMPEQPAKLGCCVKIPSKLSQRFHNFITSLKQGRPSVHHLTYPRSNCIYRDNVEYRRMGSWKSIIR